MNNFRVLWLIDKYGKSSSGKTRLESFLETANKITDSRIPDLFLFTTYDDFNNSNPLSHEWVNAAGEKRRIIEIEQRPCADLMARTNELRNIAVAAIAGAVVQT